MDEKEKSQGEKLLEKRQRMSVRRQVKSDVADYKRLKPREAQRFAKADYKDAKKDYKEAKNAVKKEKENVKILAKKNFGKRNVDQKSLDKLKEAKKKKRAAKKTKKAAKKTKKLLKKEHPTGFQKVRNGVKRSVKYGVRSSVEANMGQDDTLGSMVQARRNAVQAKRTAKTGYRAGKAGAKVTYRTGRAGYRAGKTAVKTTAKATQTAVRATAVAVKAVVTTLLANPITWFVGLISAFLIFIVIMVSSIFSSNIIQQTEYTLNQAWVQVSQSDGKKSDYGGGDVYYTDIDSVLLYMNYRYGGEWEPDAPWDDGFGGKIAGFLDFNHFSDALDDIWKNMYKDKDNPKTMADLYGKKSEVKWIKLDSDELDEYKDLLDAQKETGKYPGLQEFENPFNPPEKEENKKKDDKKDKDKEDKSKETVTVTSRFGYHGKDMYTDTILEAKQNAKIYAVMDGTVEVTKKDIKGDDGDGDSNNVIIKTDKAEFIYYNVATIRVKSKDKVKAGDEIGQVRTDKGLRIAYAKQFETADKKHSTVTVKNSMKDYVFTRHKDKEPWMYMNPGFYFPFVTYSQKTSLGSSGGSKTSLTPDQVAQKAGISKERAADVIAIVNQLGSEGATVQGIAGALANCERESNFDPKAVNPGGGVAGYFQWSGWGNSVNGSRWATASSKTLDSKVELDLLHRELNGGYKDVKAYLATAKDSVEVAKYWSLHYEGVQLSDGQTKIGQISDSAKKFENIFKGTMKTEAKNGSGPGGTKASSFNFPQEYKDKLKWPQPSQACITGYPGNAYPQGQCTFYVKNRVHETWNIDVVNNLGNGQDWVRSLTALYGWRATGKPEVGAVCSTAGGFDFTMAAYGHVSFVEAVNDDGSFLVSELNYMGNQTQVHWRVANNAAYYSFAMPPGH
ncbi:phage tail tip lysozyme [Streptococcus sobrinus]|uniref:phage tail tip lysozyme n=3 Tax=Streptococcus sobrinus TaxID=1310 RepID=UPI00030F87D7|nr:phage tail tip lysozyme [Streptococcus sobrinus]